MDYVHEDMETMNKELEQWGTEFRKNCDALEDEQRKTEEKLLPLKTRLAEVQEQIQEQQQKINTVRASIAKNDTRVEELLRDMVLSGA